MLIFVSLTASFDVHFYLVAKMKGLELYLHAPMYLCGLHSSNLPLYQTPYNFRNKRGFFSKSTTA
jgi:hypothetical protein